MCLSFCLCRFGDDIPGMEGLGTGEFIWGFKYQYPCSAGGWATSRLICFADITVICPWEAFNHLELHELAQYGIIWAFLHLPAIPWGLQVMYFKPSASGSTPWLYMELFHKLPQWTGTNTKNRKREKECTKTTFLSSFTGFFWFCSSHTTSAHV